MNAETQSLSNGFHRLPYDAAGFEAYSALCPVKFSRVMTFQAQKPEAVLCVAQPSSATVSGTVPVRVHETGDWKVARTRRLESLMPQGFGVSFGEGFAGAAVFLHHGHAHFIKQFFEFATVFERFLDGRHEG
jgi:hypothetical protein